MTRVRAKVMAMRIAPEPNGPTFTPYLQLGLSEFSPNEVSALLSPILTTAHEIDEVADWLVSQVQSAREDAKQLLEAG